MKTNLQFITFFSFATKLRDRTFTLSRPTTDKWVSILPMKARPNTSAKSSKRNSMKGDRDWSAKERLRETALEVQSLMELQPLSLLLLQGKNN